MIDIIVPVIFLCFLVGIVSSALFVASFYLYKESRRTPQATVAAASEIAVNTVEAIDTSWPAVKRPTLEATEPKIIATTGVANQCDDRVSWQTHCATDNNTGSDAASCSCACEFCGTCFVGDGNRQEKVRTDQGDSCPLQGPQRQQQLAPAYPCGEFFITGVDVGFKCQDGSSRGGTFFFYRGRQSGALLEPVCPSDKYLIIAALPSVPYNLWFCTAGHAAKSRFCHACRMMFSFELCDSEILFHCCGRKSSLAGSVWLLACEETADGKTSVLYRGDAHSLTSLYYSDKLLVYFGLYEATGCATAAASAILERHDHLAQGDLVTPAASADGERRQWRVACTKDDCGDANGDGGKSECDIAALDIETVHTDSPPSMSSAMRRAVRWPITQIENLIESSSSADERQSVGAPRQLESTAETAVMTEATATPTSQMQQTAYLDSSACDNAAN